MVNLSWLGQILFFGAYFIAWYVKEIPHTTWLNITALGAIITAVMLLIFNGYPYFNDRRPQA